MRRVLLILALLAATVSARAASPFDIAPRLEQDRIIVSFTIPPGHHVYADQIHFELAGTSVPFTMPPPADVPDKFSGEMRKTYAQSFEASHSLPSTPSPHLPLVVRFQGCDDARCYFPESRAFELDATGKSIDAAAQPSTTPAGSVQASPWRDLAARFTVTARGSGYLNEKELLALLDRSDAPAKTETNAGIGLWATIGLIVLGGIGLNLTPCILPLIPINLAIIGAGAQAGSGRRGFALGGCYAIGMAIAYGLLGVVVVLTGAKFGTLNSSPWFNAAMAAVFIMLALAMFDVLAIDFSRFQTGAAAATGGAKSKFAVAFTMGSVAALLAGACVAPVVISVLLQATALYNRGIVAGLVLPFLLGTGMGLPWPFAGAGLSFLPKPGRWMMRVKYGFGVMIAAMALYYGWLAYGLWQPAAVGIPNGSPGAQLQQALERADRDGQPVFIDFWASWCKNCSAMDHTTFRTAAVTRRLQDFHLAKIQAERPNESPAKEILDYFGAMGLPTYVVLTPRSGAVPDAPTVSVHKGSHP